MVMTQSVKPRLSAPGVALVSMVAMLGWFVTPAQSDVPDVKTVPAPVLVATTAPTAPIAPVAALAGGIDDGCKCDKCAKAPCGMKCKEGCKCPKCVKKGRQ